MSVFESSPPRPVDQISRWTAPFDGSLQATELKSSTGKRNVGSKTRLNKLRSRLEPLQELLYAGKQFAVLCIFQALDAAGKDGTIRQVFSGLDPAGVTVSAFKRPTSIELAHDFLWRTNRKLPARGEIGIFNRSYYEEVLTVRVHPEYLNAQYPAGVPDTKTLWPARFQAIREHERHLAQANTVILKFWLQVSVQEQAQRFLDRVNEPDKRWKFSSHDVAEAGFRPAYDEAVLDMLNQTSRPWAPWFIIPADDKQYMRHQVAGILHHSLSKLPLAFPQPGPEDKNEMREIARKLEDIIKPSGS